MLRYTLPYPPSTNGLFFNASRGRAKTGHYRAWLKAAGEEILAQGRSRVRGPVAISILVGRPDKRRRDISNLIKGVEDLLVTMQVIDDDSNVERVSAQWSGEPGSCVVLVHSYEREVAA